jgi:hypothetical protein
MPQTNSVEEQIAYLGANSPVALTALQDGRGRAGKTQRAQIQDAYEAVIVAADDNAGAVSDAPPAWFTAGMAGITATIATKISTEVRGEVHTLHSSVGSMADRMAGFERRLAAQEVCEGGGAGQEGMGTAGTHMGRGGAGMGGSGATWPALQARVEELALEQRLLREATKEHGGVNWRPTKAGTAAKAVHWELRQEQMRLEMLIAQNSGVTSNKAALACVKEKLGVALISNIASSAGVVRLFKDTASMSPELIKGLLQAEKRYHERAASGDDNDDEVFHTGKRRRRAFKKNKRLDKGRGGHAGDAGSGGGNTGAGHQDPHACWDCGTRGHVAAYCPG